MNKKITILYWSVGGVIALFLCSLYAVPLLSGAEQPSPLDRVRHIRINGVDLWFPIRYMADPVGYSLILGARPNMDSIEQDSERLAALYPDFKPLQKSQNQLWKEGERYRYVHWLIKNPVKMKSLQDVYDCRGGEEFCISVKDFCGATELKGKEYDLLYFSQPEGGHTRRCEIWADAENNPPHFFIQCSYPDVPVPQCSYKSVKSGLWYKINFNKELLPHWHEIQNSVFSLMEKFRKPPE